MIATDQSNRELKIRGVVVAVLATLAAGLGIVDHAATGQSDSVPAKVKNARVQATSIDATVDSVLTHQSIHTASLKTRVIRLPDGTIIRRETRIDVPETFNGALCNMLMSQALAPFDVRVIGTEHSKERVMLLHMRKDGIVIRTLVFTMQPT